MQLKTTGTATKASAWNGCATATNCTKQRWKWSSARAAAACRCCSEPLGIGYGRAARLIDFMAEDGIVGGYNGSNAREVMYTPEKWAAFRGSGGAEKHAG